MNILATEPFGARSSIRGLRAAGTSMPPAGTGGTAIPGQTKQGGDQPGNPLPCH